jgi:hypothetical protein
MEVYRRYPHKTLGDSYTPPVMALQIGLVGCSWLLAGALAVRRRGIVRLLLTAVLGAFGVTTLPLAARATAGGLRLTLCVAPLVYARSAAQGIGIVLGIARLVMTRSRGTSEWRLDNQPAAKHCAGADRENGDSTKWHPQANSPTGVYAGE